MRPASLAATAVFGAVALTGLVVLVAVPAESKTAIGLAVIACALAAASYATTPDLDDLGNDVKMLRETVEGRTSPAAQSHTHHPPLRLARAFVFGLILLIVVLCRRRGR